MSIKQKKILPSFDEIVVSTRTIIGTSNISINIEDVFNQLDTTHYTVIPKKRGRKKNVEVVNPNTHLKDGDIITLKYQNELKGVDLKKNNKKKKKLNKKYFRNSLTIVMFLDNKFINFKVSNNGKFQMTGCKYSQHAINCIKIFIDHIKHNYTKDIEVTFLTVMTNIDFNLGFLVNRENLDLYINNFTRYNSLLETSFGYTGVNIKFPMEKDIDMDLEKIILSRDTEKWVDTKTTYNKFVSTVSEKEQEKYRKKKRYNTFLVFHSGNVIMSGMVTKYMRDVYNNFINIIKDNKDDIEEKLRE